jgi:DeoR/GlpR family transcriptional regulator of sugar metabolism
MLANERHEEILRQLGKTGTVRTTALARKLKVSDETVRNDFEVMERDGMLQRIHGGARRLESARRELPLSERLSINREEKSAMARLAAARVRPNETIFLDASSTVLTMTEYLPEIPLTILTNAQNVVQALSGRTCHDVICTGGLHDPRSRSYIGLLAEEALRRYQIHRMFFSGNAFDLERGVSEVNSRQAIFKERVIPLSEEVCLLADHTKLGLKSAFFFCGVRQVTTLITDAAADEKFLKAVAKAGVAVELAPKEA